MGIETSASDPYRTSGPIDWYEVTPGGELMRHEIVTNVQLMTSGSVDVPHIPVADPFPSPKVIQMKGGTLTKEGAHFCDPPKGHASNEALPPGVKIELGDVWTCKCTKKRYWNGGLWSEFEPK